MRFLLSAVLAFSLFPSVARADPPPSPPARRSALADPGAVAAGVPLMLFGFANLVAGAVLYVHGQHEIEGRPNGASELVAGHLLVFGLVQAGVGVPLVAWGARDTPAAQLRVGVNGATLTW